MSDVKSCLRAVEKSRAAKADARERIKQRIEWRDRIWKDTGSIVTPDNVLRELQEKEESARVVLRQAKADLEPHAAAHVKALAADRAKIAKAGLAALDALVKAELADRALMADHAWSRPPAVIGELPDALHFLRARLEAKLHELEPAKTGRAA